MRPAISSANSMTHDITEALMKQSIITECLRKLQPLDKATKRFKQLVEATVQFTSQDMQPLAVVEGGGFRHLLAIVEPRFVLPSRTYFTQTEIPKLYVDVKEKVKAVVVSAPFHCITTDLWTSQYQSKGYITLTTHFVDGEWLLLGFVLATSEMPM